MAGFGWLGYYFPDSAGKIGWRGYLGNFVTINRETWTRCRADYITGKGSLVVVATRHGLKPGSVERRARQENWTELRCEFEKRALERLLPPASPRLPPTPVAPDGAISDAWLLVRQEIHYRKNLELLDKVRGLLDAKLTASEKPSADELGKLTSAISGLVSAEIAQLGLNRRRDNRRPRRMPSEPVPEPDPEPIAPIDPAIPAAL